MKIFFLLICFYFTFSSYGQSNEKIDFGEITIGNQIWADKNLSVTTFLNGDPITQIKTDAEWLKALKMKTPGWCYYDNNAENGSKYGVMYNWYAVNDARKLAPKGWHISTAEEWNVLHRSTKPYSGVILKSKSGWNGNQNGTDSISFNALPGGYRTLNGRDDKPYFFGIGEYVNYWTADKSSQLDWSIYKELSKDNTVLNGNAGNRISMYYVRCIKDEIPSTPEKVVSNNKKTNEADNDKLSNILKLKNNNSIAHLEFNIEDSYLTEKQNIDLALKEYDSILFLNENINNEIKAYKIQNEDAENILKTLYDKIIKSETYLFINKENLSYSHKNKSILKHHHLKYSLINDSLLFFVITNSNPKQIQTITKFGYDRFMIHPRCLKVDRFDFSELKENKSIRNLISLTKVYKSDLLVKNENKEKLAKRYTGMDSRYFELIENLKINNKKLDELKSKFVVEFNSDYYYFGEKTDSYKAVDESIKKESVLIHKNKQKVISINGIDYCIQANGFGYLIFNRKQNAPIVLSGYWENGYAIEIKETNLYSDMPSLKIKKYNSNNQIEIDENGLIIGENNGNVFNGKALRLWTNGNYFYGTYQNGWRTEGLQQWKNGDKYQGSFNSNNMDGYGTYFWKDGTKYVGEWKQGNITGYGTKTYTNGSITEGIWENNNLIKSKATIEQENYLAEQNRLEFIRQQELEERKKIEAEKLQNAKQAKFFLDIFNNSNNQSKNFKSTCDLNSSHKFSGTGFSFNNKNGDCEVISALYNWTNGEYCSKECAYKACLYK